MGRKLAEILAEIETWESPAHELEKRGIKGSPGCGKTCPMALFILGELEITPETRWIHVDGWTTDTFDEDNRITQSLDNPRNMTYFIQDFDDGEYRDLAVDPDKHWPEWDDDEDDWDSWIDAGDEEQEEDEL